MVVNCVHAYDRGLPTAQSEGSLYDKHVTDDGHSEHIEYDYDWATFMSAYAAGRWDPHRIPNPPRSHHALPVFTEPRYSIADHQDNEHQTLSSSVSEMKVARHSPGSSSSSADFYQSSPEKAATISIPAASALKRPNLPPRLNSSTMLTLRNSFSEMRLQPAPASVNPTQPINQEMGASHSNSDLATTVATMRWAAARVNLAPLALPSPEHELADPMRGVTASIPPSHHELLSYEPLSSGGARKKPSTSFWAGTRDVEDNPSDRLSVIEASPPGSTRDSPAGEHPPKATMPFPASAPLVRNNEFSFSDYFGTPGLSPDEAAQITPVAIRRSSSPPPEIVTMSVPAVAPRRTTLSRQISSPLPESTRLQRYTQGRVDTANTLSSIKLTRAAKEEQMYADLGYLVPPAPPDEFKRRRALSK